jgi:cytochrome c biogenesis protein
MFIGKMDFAQYYKDNYGWTGTLYHAIGLSNTYDSWWFKGLLAMIGASLVICSLDRVLPLYRALAKKAIRKHPTFLLRQKIRYEGALSDNGQAIPALRRALQNRHYRVYTDGQALFAEKNRFSRWGPYINHIGLIIFLVACLVRSMFAWNLDFYAVQEGQTKQIGNTGYYMKNEDFNVTMYPNGQTVKAYTTKAVLYKCVENCDSPGNEPTLKQLTAHNIKVNHPLKYRELTVFNVDYQSTPMIIGATVHIWDVKSNKELGTFNVDLLNPKSVYAVNGYTLNVLGYYPEAKLANGKFTTLSSEPKAPAFVFNIEGPNLPKDGQIYLYFVRPIDKVNYDQDLINERAGSKVKLGIGTMADVQLSEFTTYFNVTRDRSMPFIWTGAAISMIGLIMGFYWHHRRIWLTVENNRILLGAHTNKNWYGIRKEVATVLKEANVVATIDDQVLLNEVEGS